jgi:hypothetical protein
MLKIWYRIIQNDCVIISSKNKDISVQLIFLLRFAGGSLSSQACVNVITAQSTF